MHFDIEERSVQSEQTLSRKIWAECANFVKKDLGRVRKLCQERSAQSVHTFSIKICAECGNFTKKFCWAVLPLAKT